MNFFIGYLTGGFFTGTIILYVWYYTQKREKERQRSLDKYCREDYDEY